MTGYQRKEQALSSHLNIYFAVAFSLENMYTFSNERRKKMKREKYQTFINKRIMEMPPGSVLVTSDFADIAPSSAINMSLSRLEASGSIRRILRGIYDKPRFSKLLNEPVDIISIRTLWGPIIGLPFIRALRIKNV